eukprot:scaffold1845_cov127-Skeletonema_dohrnii-CCMP3373.AAC.8
MTDNASAAAAVNNINESDAQSSSVPHVIRVTFLGVAGILVNPPNNNPDDAGPRLQSAPINFPPPSNLRAVASISRTYKSGGKPSGLSNCLSKPPSGRGSSEINSSNSEIDKASALSAEPERFVAVWNDDCQDLNQNLINTSNDVAFEADLVPSMGESENDPSSTFAPKTFCITLGLVPDNVEEEITPNEGGGGAVGPMVAIPIGFSHLIINGEETLNGRRKQLDLPLTSVSNLIGPFGVESPLMKLTKAVDGADATEAKAKKSKSIVKRMFKKGTKSANGADRSIFQLGRPPNNEERNLFLERFGVDQSGDAIVRVALEVFPRGSDLEKTFKQKAKLRKRKQRKQAETKNTARVTPSAIHSSMVEKRDDISAVSSSSLVDDADDGSADSDCSQSYTQISSDGEESWDNGNTGSWGDDEETFATFEDTVGTMDTMDTRDISLPPPTSNAKGVFGRMFDCAVPTCTKEDDYLMVDDVAGDGVSHYNIDAVASAMASMSMSVNGQETDKNSMSNGSPEKNIPSRVVTTKVRESAKTKESDAAKVPTPSPVAIPNPQKSTEDGPHDSGVAEVLKFNASSIQLQESTESKHDSDVPGGSNLNETLVFPPKVAETVIKANNSPKDAVPKKKEKTRGGFFRRNHSTKKEKKSTAAMKTPPLAEVLPDDIMNQIDEEIEGHEFTLAQHSQNSF